MRSPVAVVASVLLAGSLVLSGCSVLSGSSDEKAKPTASKSAPAPLKELPSTAWRTADPSKISDGGSLRLAAAAMPTNFNPLHADAALSDAEQILAPTTGSAVRITADGAVFTANAEDGFLSVEHDTVTIVSRTAALV
jgi:peptide/nickel transport system substrate-binding protein